MSIEEKAKKYVLDIKINPMVTINVSGRTFITNKTTLSVVPFFKYIFDANPKTDYYYINRPACHFEKILNFLQTGFLEKTDDKAFENELKFYQVKTDLELKDETKIKVVDKKLKEYSFKSNIDGLKTFVITKKKLEDYPDSLLLKLTTSDIGVSMDGFGNILLDSTEEDLNVLFIYLLEGKYSNAKKLMELLDIYCIHTKRHKLYFEYIKNTSDYRLITNVEYDIDMSMFEKYQLRSELWVNILSVIGIVEYSHFFSGSNDPVQCLSTIEFLQVGKRIEFETIYSQTGNYIQGSSFTNPFFSIIQTLRKNELSSTLESLNWKLIIVEYSHQFCWLVDKSTIWTPEYIMKEKCTDFFQPFSKLTFQCLVKLLELNSIQFIQQPQKQFIILKNPEKITSLDLFSSEKIVYRFLESMFPMKIDSTSKYFILNKYHQSHMNSSWFSFIQETYPNISFQML